VRALLPEALASVSFDIGPKGPELEGRHADIKFKGAYTRRKILYYLTQAPKSFGFVIEF